MSQTLSKAKNVSNQSYAHQEALKKTTEYFQGDALAANVWINKYSLKNSQGELFELTPDDMHHRLAKELARIEKKYPKPLSENKIYDLIKNFQYIIPQGSPMAGIGNNFQVASLSNCFVLGLQQKADSYGGIMKVDEEQVQLMKRRGGVGHDLSHIRPKGSPVKNCALTATGIVPFMERYSNSTREVAQDGRRGALMLSVSIEHPDVENFIDAKMTPGKVTGANVSVRITDEFMDAVIKNKPFVQTFPIGSKNPTYKNVIDAGKLWKKIIHNAWQSAEPGILFWDTIIKESVPDSYADLGFKTTSTNPCGEIPLCPYDSCRLIALNLYSYVKNPFTKNASFDFDLFKKHVSYTQRMMDDIIDLELEKIDVILDKVNSDPEPEEIKSVERNLWTNIKNKSIAGRRTGIGVTAEGDMLAALGYRYGTEEATKFSVKIHQTLAIETYRSSILLARERKPFPIFDFKREKDNPFIKRLEKIDPSIIKQMKKYGRRNIALLTIAPTGSVSICTQTTSGIEPVFMVSYKRRRKINPNDKNVKIAFVDEVGDSWEEYNVFHPKFVIWLKLNNYDPKKISLLPEKELNEIIKKSPYYKATANDVDWVAKVDMQGKIQKWVDHSISVTVNIPKETTEDLVDKIYQTAWKSGCKGVTIYREGSRAGVLISKETTQKQKSNGEEIVENEAPSRPKALEAEVVRFQNDYDKWIAVVGTLKGKPYEIFTGKADEFFIPPSIEKGWVIRNINGDGKSRYDFEFVDKDGYKTITEGLSRSFNKEFWNYAKLISGVLRHGMPLPHVLSLVSDLNLNSTSINTWKNGVQRAFKKFIPDGTKAVNGEVCFYCKAKDSLIYQEGCLVCKNCGQSKCG
ncbi:ribonucleoside-diphosphate reductase, adenosylcobalamin-dependent [candidate division CPR3 bacterium GWF2_35_18]|uniref:Vitamin B12-dependent ribonucleotide reductase n=1 Tax=candidate division CPR3 bacterium GW2011_GWF2_35_18 TaxID=1618350 RepID=A0A0G0C1T3_UNCC3|nr:MAG: ribonucleoside-diphosphate reductase [candidate division CPR3 bacterium GW2011_GWF2_35_18]OGB62864.1 MAG: ribonucleoside-diphosphate reductase, adenosylcobalamin-dependent [candidate division CPR3 bacterium GWF2_35_18]OGB65445.1 MAG: ribonucleoside-diphosphate reductase, adenosylcobalamin-dependent [candidate division CPR3 bacterium RIFOXYA2_FULL_35_13]OGB76756.1 MAG: ribonucleoside-diphosphate reductase, adenosylcobalamin-dependent [candidate division CPR3 bacterium RIFOXYC2_FULL_35_7]